MWQSLFTDSVNVEHALGGIKRTFTEVPWRLRFPGRERGASAGRVTASCFPQITRSEIMNFRQQMEDFAKRFYSEGPGSVGEDLDIGKDSLAGLPQVCELRSLYLAVLGGDVAVSCARTPGSPGESGKTTDPWGPGPNCLTPLFWAARLAPLRGGSMPSRQISNWRDLPAG